MSDETVPQDDESTVYDPVEGRVASEDGQLAIETTRYRLGVLLGEGGMASVVEAEDTRLGRNVAIKRLKPKLAGNAEIRDRFLDEARIMAGLAHPGAIAVHDIGRLADGQVFYAMEKVQGDTLRDLLDRRAPEAVANRHEILHLVDLFVRACETVAYAHTNGFIHRDLKPANIMVDRYGAVFVLDWGLAKKVGTPQAPFTSDRTQVGVVMGTPGYMSPEQTKNTAAADLQTDVFALGVTLYEILTDRRAFVGHSAEELLRDVLHNDPDPPRSRNLAAGRELSAICMKALSKDPQRRYANASELVEDLRYAREFRPVSAVKPRLVDHLLNAARRRPAVAAVLATLLSVGILLGAVMAGQARTRNRLMTSTFDLVENTQQRITDLQTRRDVVIQQKAVADPPDQTVIDHDIADLDARLLVQRFRLRGQLGALVGLTLDSPDPRALELARADTLKIARRLVGEDDNPWTARAFLETVIDSIENDNILAFDLGQVDEVRDLLAKAEVRVQAARENE